MPSRLKKTEGFPDLSVELFGQRLPFPIACAPVGVQRIFNPDGEVGAAAAQLKQLFRISWVLRVVQVSRMWPRQMGMAFVGISCIGHQIQTMTLPYLFLFELRSLASRYCLLLLIRIYLDGDQVIWIMGKITLSFNCLWSDRVLLSQL